MHCCLSDQNNSSLASASLLGGGDNNNSLGNSAGMGRGTGGGRRPPQTARVANTGGPESGKAAMLVPLSSSRSLQEERHVGCRKGEEEGMKGEEEDQVMGEPPPDRGGG